MNRLTFGLRLLGIATLALGCVLIYWPCVNGGFIWDDRDNIQDNEQIHSPTGLYDLWFTTKNVDYWPLTNTTWWIEWRLWGEQTAGYHVVNLLLHIAGATMFWFVLRQLKARAAWFIAAVFAFHPVNVESVAWITERKNTLSMCLAMLSLLLFLKSGSIKSEDSNAAAQQPDRGDRGRRHHYIAAIAVFALAMLAKTSVAPLPIVFLLLGIWPMGRVSRRTLLRTIPFFCVSLILAAVTVWFQYKRAMADDVTLVRDDGMVSRVAIAGKAIAFYCGKLILPTNLMFVYPRWPIGRPAASDFVPTAILFTAIVGLVVVAIRKPNLGRGPLVCLLSYIVMLAPVIGFLNIYFMRFSLVSDHWQYVPSMAAIALLVGSASWAIQTYVPSKWPGRILAAIVLITLTVLSHRQSRIYQDNETLWRDTIARNASDPLSRANLAELHLLQGRAARLAGRESEALAEFEQAVCWYREEQKVKPFAPHQIVLGQTLAEAGHFEQGVQTITDVVQQGSVLASEAHFALGKLFLERGDAKRAILEDLEALKGKSEDDQIWVNLGVAYARVDQLPAAVDAYRHALSLKQSVEANLNLGIAYLKMNRSTEALASFGIANQLDPGDPRPIRAQAVVYAQNGRRIEAANAFTQAGKAFASRGEYSDAADQYIAALQQNPGEVDAQMALDQLRLKGKK